MKQKIMLIIGGTVAGLVLVVLLTPVFIWVGNRLHHGSSFATLDDLRHAMIQRDMHDLKSVTFRSIVRPHPSDKIIYTLVPNLDVVFWGVRVQTNSFGMRGPEIQVEKGPNQFRVALLGDSLAFGWGVDEDKTFARVLERKLQEHFAGQKQVQLLNFGVPGYSTFQEVAQFLEAGWQFKPDVVLVYLHVSDFGLPFFIRDIESEKKGIIALADAFKGFWRKKDAQTEEKKRKMNELVDPNQALTDLVAAAKEKNFRVFLAIDPQFGLDWRIIVDQRLWVLRNTPEIQVIAMYDEFERIARQRGFSQEVLFQPKDPFHNTAIGHQILGWVLAHYMIPKL